jgi:hypothetical protein
MRMEELLTHFGNKNKNKLLKVPSVKDFLFLALLEIR